MNNPPPPPPPINNNLFAADNPGFYQEPVVEYPAVYAAPQLSFGDFNEELQMEREENMLDRQQVQLQQQSLYEQQQIRQDLDEMRYENGNRPDVTIVNDVDVDYWG